MCKNKYKKKYKTLKQIGEKFFSFKNFDNSRNLMSFLRILDIPGI